ncbi:MAG: nuclear transport factor 2 family protein, partial [Pyrinomonadaceae bacterium]
NLSSNSSSNPSNLNENANAPESEVTAPPTDQDAVLNDLTNLEHEWTVANINADKKKLDRILAADYVGTDLNGKALGKAEYIEKIERDTTTQKWDFEDLKLALKGTRATLSGVVKFQTNEGELRYRFTDKFVWRDGRWQATGSEIGRIT